MNGLVPLLELERLRLLRGRSLLFAVITAGFVVLLAFAARHAGAATSTAVLDETANLGVIRFLSLLVPCAFAAGAISDELSARTLVYLTVRPTQRATIVLGKWLAAAVASSAVVIVSSLLLHVVCSAFTPEGVFAGFSHALAIALAATLESLVCSGICLTFGVVAARGGSMLAFLFIAFFELLMSFAPGRLRLLSMAHHALGVASLDSGGIAEIRIPTLARSTHVAVLVVVALAWLATACVVFSVREYRGSEGE